MGKKPTKEITPKQTSPSQLIYQMKVSLIGIKPPIWRRIQVTGDTTLEILHTILQTAMGWFGGHLYEFVVHGISYGDLSMLTEGNVIDEKTVNLTQLISHEKERFRYLYDFGDGWEHDILVEKILPIEKEIHYPVCTDGRRSCPPEDCGGPFGYEELLEILKDLAHPEHEEKFEWLPGDFDPDKFDIEHVNRELGGS
jgi:hypothetical protein